MRDAIRKALAANLNAKDATVVLNWARSEFGRTVTRGFAKQYESKERALALETRPILVRNALVAPEAKEAKSEAEAAAPSRSSATRSAIRSRIPPGMGFLHPGHFTLATTSPNGEAGEARFGVKADPWKEIVSLRKANGRLSKDWDTLQALVEKLGRGPPVPSWAVP